MKQSDIMPYIYDGRNAMPGDAPWQVSLRDALVHWNHSCGGSILSVEWIVTSGYCGDPYTAMPEYNILKSFYIIFNLIDKFYII